MKNRIPTVAPWLIGVASLLASTAASAASYAVSTDTITNFSLTFTSEYSFYGVTASADASISVGDLTGLELDVERMDADPACVGVYCSTFDNNFAPNGASSYPGYSYGDAQIVSKNVTAGTGEASSIGEATIYNGLATAAGGNMMQAGFYLTSEGSLSFSFLATPYMRTDLGAGALGATSLIDMEISIWKSGSEVFHWAPNGQAGGITGGAETSDPFSLNSTFTGNALYDPGTDTFSASTGSLGTGLYSMNIRMGNLVHVEAVPVPAALPLFGSGVLALAVLIRRKRAQA